MCSNLQEGKDKICPCHHFRKDGKRYEGSLVQLQCNVKYYIFTPIVTGNELSVQYMVIISKGEHNHPPPPLRHLSAQVKT